MKGIKRLINSIIDSLKRSAIDNALRRNFLFRWLNIVLCFVSLVFSIINIITKEYVLMIATLSFTLACLTNAIVSCFVKSENKALYGTFGIETLSLIIFFIITGIPDGLSVFWVCLIPSFSIVIFGKKAGVIYSLLAFIMIIFFFWVPLGNNLLQFDYSDSFLIRFPFLYISILIISLVVDLMRSETKQQLIIAEQKYKHLYRHDSLTTLYNRYGFNEKINDEFTLKEDKPVALLMVDLDNFKFINDEYGHDSGDYVLQNFAKLLEQCLCKDCYYCRWGGEEFTVFMPCKHDPVSTSEQIRKTVEDFNFEINGYKIKLTVSIGVCIASSKNNTSIAQLLNLADKALYEAKNKGKNIVCLKKIS